MSHSPQIEPVPASSPSLSPDNRRRDQRFEVPGGLVRAPCRPFQVDGLFFGVLPSLFWRRYELVNVSKGGLAFESGWPVARGATLSIQLWLPDRDEPLELVGETRWCSRERDGSFRVGVQFARSPRTGSRPA
jgi:hypothetical protein